MSLDGNNAEYYNQKLSENIYSNVGGGQGGNREVSHMSGMAENADTHVGGMGITCARGDLYGKSGVENYLDSA